MHRTYIESIHGAKHSRMDQVKHFKFFKGCLPQIYLVHSWILCVIQNFQKASWTSSECLLYVQFTLHVQRKEICLFDLVLKSCALFESAANALCMIQRWDWRKMKRWITRWSTRRLYLLDSHFRWDSIYTIHTPL